MKSDLIQYGYNPENTDSPWVEDLSVTYNQTNDCCGNDGEIQAITLTSVNNGIVPFIRISIPTDSPGYWSISDINDLKLIVEDFEKRINFHE